MSKNTQDLVFLIEETLTISRNKVATVLVKEYKYDEKKALEIEKAIYASTKFALENMFIFKSGPKTFDFLNYAKEYKNSLEDYSDFANWSWIALTIPYYQSLGDTIGYYNSEWEFNRGNIHAGPEYVNELIYEFIYLGGVNDFSVKNLLASDDTILYLATMQVLCDGFENIQEFGEKIKEEYIKSVPLIKNRYPGTTTLSALNFQRTGEWNKLPYDSESKGAGSAMRSGCIGIFFPGSINRKKLIELAIESSRITHNSTLAILGSITTALFTAYSLEKVAINKWPNKLLKILKSDIIDNYLKKSRPNDYEFYLKDKKLYTGQWDKYIRLLFTGIGPDLDIKFMKNPVSRYKYLTDNFSKGCETPGSCADDAIIMAYDSLARCSTTFEKILIYSVLHPGDSDTVGSIALSWFGGYYHSPRNELIVRRMFKNLEFYDKINELFKKALPLMVKVYYHDIYLHFARRYLKDYKNK
jgi:ADP-ribosylglycohydrolase